MPIKLNQPQIDNIRSHAARDYPSECCGILLGKSDDGNKVVSEVVALRNLRHDPVKAQELLPLESPDRETDRNRFLIDPMEQLQVEKDARKRGLDVVGYYHSHPDHPARPSNYDRDHAWPWYSYIILSVVKGTPADMTSWVLNDNRERFDPEAMEIVNP
ncbi:MAG: M67 family metallopeptidase [Terriglobia bacterium]